MVRKRRTKRKRGDIWAQLGVSACVLLLPPLVMAAGVMVLGSSQPQGQQGAAQQAAAPQVAAPANTSASVAERSDLRPDGATSFALASAETHPVIAEKRPASGQPAVAAQRAPAGRAAAAKDPTRYVGAAPVTLVHAGTAGEQSALAEVEAPAPAKAAADAPAAAPEESPAATRIRGFHGRNRMGRHEPRAVYRVRYQRSRSSDMFARPRRG